jgi:hypothetical protein
MSLYKLAPVVVQRLRHVMLPAVCWLFSIFEWSLICRIYLHKRRLELFVFPVSFQSFHDEIVRPTIDIIRFFCMKKEPIEILTWYHVRCEIAKKSLIKSTTV